MAIFWNQIETSHYGKSQIAAIKKFLNFNFYFFKTTAKWKKVQDLLNLQKENEMIQHNARLEVIATEQRAADIRVQFEEVNLQIAMEELKKIRYQNSK